MLLLGVVIWLPTTGILLHQGMWDVAAINSAALGWIGVLWWWRRLSYKARVLNFLAINLLIGVALMVVVGPISEIYLFSAPVLAAILLGTWPAVWILAGSGLVLFILCYAGYVNQEIVGLPATDLFAALSVALNYLFVGAILTLSCAFLLRRLAKSLDDLHRLAFYDVLTGLPNRRLLMQRLDELVDQARQGGRGAAVMFIDLDRFKQINDGRGHATGDGLLKSVAARLSRFAADGDMVARIGGDEFVVLLADLGRGSANVHARALATAENIRDAMDTLFEIDGQAYMASVSIGVAFLRGPAQGADDLLREADTAMYRAKLAGRNRVAVFEAAMQAEVEQRLILERDLAGALDRGELAMHPQLQVDRHGMPAGAEMLMRWRRADGSMVPSDVFIPVAEECGLIPRLGQWALRQSCEYMVQLGRAGHALPLSVNVSPSQFRQPDFIDQLQAILAETGAPASQLILEVTEGLLVNGKETIDRMHQLDALGIRLSIDDFGTGYSNLGYLKRLPLYEIKIDKSFIRDTPGDASATAIVQSILAMAGHLDLRVIAEGVETAEQAALLVSNGVGGMQGYLFARPMPMPELLALLERDTVPSCRAAPCFEVSSARRAQ
ncbi:Phytochrome-like protein cph2 [Massilia sp. 9I]|nr:EAL domain-containing protein [Massilia sp. 9I]VXB96546.1 Phytochrome-like protein cph2 [Massilia sp. 9I]